MNSNEKEVAVTGGMSRSLLLGVEEMTNPTTDPRRRRLFVPAIALALPQSAMIARLLQTTMNSTRGEDFVDLAKAKGVPRGRIVRKHVLRNSLGPAIVAIGLRIGDLLAGAIIIEAINRVLEAD